MRSRYLVRRFQEHLDLLAQTPGDHSVSQTDPVMTLYGTDEFRIDRKQGAIHLPAVGWISCPDISKFNGNPEWVGVLRNEGRFDAVLGFGNPYAQNYPAVPHALLKGAEENPAGLSAHSRHS